MGKIVPPYNLKNKLDPNSIHVNKILFSHDLDRKVFQVQKKEQGFQRKIKTTSHIIDVLFIVLWITFIIGTIIAYEI